MANTKIDSGAMRRLASRLDALAEDYEYLYEHDLYVVIVDNIRRAYKGVDADALVYGLEGFKNDFRRLKRTINQYADFLRRAARRYDELQEELAARARQLTSDAD